MKILLSFRGLFALSLTILLATNIVVLSGVIYNRSGHHEAQITLTERELQLPYRVRKENTGLALRLAWRALGRDEDYSNYPGRGISYWLNAEKLEALGFNLNDALSSNKNTTYYKRSIPKEVFIVLEINGESYSKAVKRAEVALEKKESSFKSNPSNKRLRNNFEKAERQLKRERITETRLFAIDAGLDPNELREKYGDRTRFIITKGLVKPRYGYKMKREEVFGYITKLSVASISVPLKHRQIFDSILAQDKSKKNKFRSPRYKIELAYGSRLEPWIVSVKSLGEQSNQKNTR